jgi:Ca2+-binding RTX toxin-like protein
VTLQFSVGDDVDDGDVVYVDNVKVSYATTASATQTINYTENSAVGILPPQITDVDNNATIHSATITLTNHQANDLLSITGALPAGITASSYDASTGVLTLTGTASLADYQDALSHILFSNTSESPSTLDRTLTITVNDGLADSNVATTTIHVTAIDDAPVAAPDTIITNIASNTAIQIPDWVFTFNDSDPDNANSQLSISGVNSVVSANVNDGNGSVSFTDTGANGGSFNYVVTDGSLTSTAQVTVSQDTSGPLDGTGASEILIARTGGTTINAGGGNDILLGNNGADIMNGGDGNDILVGGNSGDTLAGNGGADTFVFKAVSDSQSGAGHFDTVTDFVSGVDHLDLTAITGATNIQGSVGAADTVAAHSISWFVDNVNNQTIVYVNTGNTANQVDMEIHLTGTNINLSGSDILHHT